MIFRRSGGNCDLDNCPYCIHFTDSTSQTRIEFDCKSARKRSPSTIVNRTVPRIVPNSELRPREYLTEKEIERLQEAARKRSRYGHRDATMILVAYRHGLRASEVCGLRWDQIE